MMNWPKHKVTWTGTKDKGWNEELEKDVFPRQKLWEENVQALDAVISGIVMVDKR